MSHGCTVSRKDRLTAHRNPPCVLPLSSLGKSEAYRTKHWPEGLKWVVTFLFGGKKRKLNTHSGCPLPLAKPALLPPPPHLPHFCLRVRMIRVFFSFPAPAARQPAATRRCVCEREGVFIPTFADSTGLRGTSPAEAAELQTSDEPACVWAGSD